MCRSCPAGPCFYGTLRRTPIALVCLLSRKSVSYVLSLLLRENFSKEFRKFVFRKTFIKFRASRDHQGAFSPLADHLADHLPAVPDKTPDHRQRHEEKPGIE